MVGSALRAYSRRDSPPNLVLGYEDVGAIALRPFLDLGA